MLTVLNNMESLRIGSTLRLAWCWKIIRTDGYVLRLTEHPSSIDVSGETYHPATFNATATQKQVGMKSRNQDLQGVLSSDYITEADLHAGMYDNCKVEMRLVDWRYPWMGVFEQRTYWIDTIQFDGEVFQTQLIGLASRCNNETGQVISRVCYKTLGASDCHVNLTPFLLSKIVGTVVSARKKFTTTFTESNPLTSALIGDGYFAGGKVTWTTGLNAGLTGEIASYTHSSGTIELFLDMPYDIQAGDSYVISPGCDLLFDTCKSKFLNGINFGGDPHVPGTDALVHPQG